MKRENRWALPSMADVEWMEESQMPPFLKEHRVQHQLLGALDYLVLVAADPAIHRIDAGDGQNGDWCWSASVFILQRDHFTGAVGGARITSVAMREDGDTTESVRDDFAHEVVLHIKRTRQGEVRFV